MSTRTGAGTVVVVDAYASARCLAPLFRARGYDCVHVQTTPEIPPNYRAFYRPADFSANIVHDGDPVATAAAVAAHAPIALIAGIERAVILADELGERLGLPTNGTALSACRRDKFEMVETIKAAGVPGAGQILAGDLDTLLQWYGDTARPVVLKPVSSAGNDGVHLCDDVTEVRKAFETLIGTTSALGQANRAVLAQDYLAGFEYIVNTVGVDGEHHVCDMWKMHHLDANGVAGQAVGSELLPRHGPEQEQIVAYTLRVLDALGIRNGPAHTELKLTPDGPRLIETGARVCGADLHVLSGGGLGESQLDWTVLAATDPAEFARRRQEDYRIERHARIINLLSPVEGVLAGYPRMDLVRQLPSFHGTWFRVNPGDPIHRTVDDWTFPGRIYLLHEDESVVARDTNTVRYLDGDGFYELR
ncbi:ATP-grasp domain-containing protein [Actinoplanes sp. KI2]|uniref:ATP-grasp domain-containing protein n=1 Tax=Actinoplanes sp. KI2 TaxID=2983315 RepID=UPI0021D6057E|nr:ATP-grasp domain-containing protein [Actinoplanes sp. KI2]MCU7727444.1 ATP-grasp domain-containing protein [Actinoplanes sp. KI2]